MNLFLKNLSKVTLILICLITPPVMAEEDDKLALQVVEAMSMIDQIKNTMPLFQNQLLMTLARKYPEADDKTIQEIKKMSDEFVFNMVATAKPKMAEIIKENFNEKEMADLLAFFTSKTGKAFVTKQPVMSNEMMQWTNNSMMNAMTSIDKQVTDLVIKEKK